MKFLERVLISLLVVAPVLFAGVVTLAPRPVQLTDAWDKVQLYESNNQGEKASPYYMTILEFQPWRSDLWERIAGNEYSAGNYSEAVTAYQQADESHKISINGLFTLGSAYLQIGDLKAASGTWLRVSEYEDVEVEKLAAMTDQLWKSGDFESAAKTAKSWSGMDPQSAQAAWTAGLLLSTQGLEEAIPFLTAARDGDGVEAVQAKQLLDGLGQAALQSNQAYQMVIIGQRLADMELWDVAEEALQTAVQLDPEYAEAWALLGEVRQQLAKDGWTPLLRAKTLNPDSDVVISALVLYWRRQEKYEVALAYLRKLAARYPDEGSWQLEIGGTLVEAGDMIEAMAAYQRATEIEPDDPQNWQSLAVFSATYGFEAEYYALPAITRALDLAPKDPQVLDAAGWVYLTSGDMEKAEQFLQLAIAEDDDFGEAKLHLAQVFIETNRLSLALPMLKDAVTEIEDRTMALIAQRLLEKYFPGQ